MPRASSPAQPAPNTGLLAAKTSAVKTAALLEHIEAVYRVPPLLAAYSLVPIDLMGAGLELRRFTGRRGAGDILGDSSRFDNSRPCA
jgi:hypothetical protein